MPQDEATMLGEAVLSFHPGICEQCADLIVVDAAHMIASGKTRSVATAVGSAWLTQTMQPANADHSFTRRCARNLPGDFRLWEEDRKRRHAHV